MIAVWIIIIVAVVVVGWVILAYNKLVQLNVKTDEAWSDIDVMCKRRYDLIPNLVETVKGYAKHEKGVFEEVTKARAEAINAKGVAEQSKAENMITSALKSIFAVAENYPDLKANENFAKLQEELSGTEDKIQASRRFYNGNVREMNIAVKTFPTNIIAGVFRFSPRELFELANESEREAVKVDFSEEKK
jgi:LemA protein